MVRLGQPAVLLRVIFKGTGPAGRRATSDRHVFGLADSRSALLSIRHRIGWDRSMLKRLDAAPLHVKLLGGFALVLAISAAQSSFAYWAALKNNAGNASVVHAA